jgi:hypothetical protein
VSGQHARPRAPRRPLLARLAAAVLLAILTGTGLLVFALPAAEPAPAPAQLAAQQLVDEPLCDPVERLLIAALCAVAEAEVSPLHGATAPDPGVDPWPVRPEPWTGPRDAPEAPTYRGATVGAAIGAAPGPQLFPEPYRPPAPRAPWVVAAAVLAGLLVAGALAVALVVFCRRVGPVPSTGDRGTSADDEPESPRAGGRRPAAAGHGARWPW